MITAIFAWPWLYLIAALITVLICLYVKRSNVNDPALFVTGGIVIGYNIIMFFLLFHGVDCG